MKKKLYTLLCLVLAFALPLAAFAEKAEMDLELEGFVTEIVDGGFVMEDAELGEVMLNTSEETVWDGILMENELEIGQYVLVQYDGRTTMSLPPQAHADKVGCYVLSGTAEEILEDGFLLTGDEVFGEAMIHVDPEADLAPVHAGMPVTVYYDGVMTMSLPGQAAAKHIVVPEVEGIVSSLTEEGFTLTDIDGVEYAVLLTDETIIGMAASEIMEEEALIAEEETEETEEETAEGSDEETEIEIVDAEEEPVFELSDGDMVTVYYNGMMTRSIPAQLTALEIIIDK